MPRGTAQKIFYSVKARAGLQRGAGIHCLRHTTAMHLLQSGVDITVIAMWLGHESIETTHLYVTTNLELKEIALEMLQPPSGGSFRFQPGDELLRFLKSL